MPRLPTPGRYDTSHVTVRCNNREYLFNLKQNFGDLVSWVNSLSIMYDVDVHHILFMSNHMHILLTPNHDNLGLAMSYFLTNTAKLLNSRSGRNDHIFGRRYRPTVVKNSRHFMNVIRYIYQNPLRARMVKQVEEYPYSSLGFYLGENNPGFIIKPDYYTQDLFNLGLPGWESWLEGVRDLLLEDDVQLLRNSFEKKMFKISTKQIKRLQMRETRLRL